MGDEAANLTIAPVLFRRFSLQTQRLGLGDGRASQLIHPRALLMSQKPHTPSLGAQVA